ncbi:hypothetical protein G6F55_014144 [Rhizopus delemar]|nr:hypothetical protein G6F55_014144 [Rhizopus delemar]
MPSPAHRHRPRAAGGAGRAVGRALAAALRAGCRAAGQPGDVCGAAPQWLQPAAAGGAALRRLPGVRRTDRTLRTQHGPGPG